MSPLSREEAAAFMRLPLSTFVEVAKANNIPYTKLGRRKIYLPGDLLDFLKKAQTAGTASAGMKEKQCQHSNVVAFGGATSPNQTERELSALCAQRTST